MSWRDHLKVHPAADLFPMMSENELRELGEDIKENGQRVQVVLWKDPSPGGKHWVLDGRNRLDAMESVGLTTFDKIGRWRFYWRLMDGDPYEVVLSLNLLRRNLTDEQRRELIAKVIKAKPEASDRTIAEGVKRDHKTVAKVRKKLEATGEVSPVEKRVGADGKKRKSRAKKKPDSSLDKLFEGAAPGRVTGSAEVSEDERRAEMTKLSGAPETKPSEVENYVICVMNQITKHANLLTNPDDQRRFYTKLSETLRIVMLARGI